MMDVANTMRKIKNFEFSFEIGGFRLDSYKIYSQDQFVITQNMDVPRLITDSNRVEISDLEWQRFWNKIDIFFKTNFHFGIIFNYHSIIFSTI